MTQGRGVVKFSLGGSSGYHAATILSTPFCLGRDSRLAGDSIEQVFAMVRPLQFPLSEPDSLVVAKVKTALKELSPEGRAFVIAWLLKFYGDSGSMFSPSITQERRRITIDGEEFWLARAPKRR
jgi:hypothetical protein